jgi:hypothetical protein
MTTGELTREQMRATLTLFGWAPMDANDFAFTVPLDQAKTLPPRDRWTSDDTHISPYLVCMSAAGADGVPVLWINRKRLGRATIARHNLGFYSTVEWDQFTDEELALLVYAVAHQEQS